MSDSPPAKWYPDPEVPNQWRYWDGAQWTEHRAPMDSPPSPAPSARAVVAPVRSQEHSDALKIYEPKLFGGRRHVADPPTPEMIAANCSIWDHGLPLDEQIEVAGETYYVKAIKKVFRGRGMPITSKGSTLEDVQACLVPEPWNPYDVNAVAVCVDGHQVGHVPADMAPDYIQLLIPHVRRAQLVGGGARIWAKSDGGVVRARVTLLMPEADALR